MTQPQTPVVLGLPFTPLYRQVLDYLATDTDPAAGLLAALGNGVNSLYPNFEAPEPSPDRTLCPTPFVIVYPAGKAALDRNGRELKTLIEVHDDPEKGFQRWPGILERIYFWLLVKEWRPTNDAVKYLTGLYFKSESPDLHEPRFTTLVTQSEFGTQVMDRTSGRGYNG